MASFKDYIIDQVQHASNSENTLDEKMTWKWRTRNGKKVKKWQTDRKNFRIQINKKTGQPKEVYISPSERLKRKIGQRKAALKRKSKQRNITAKRLRSFGVRSKWGMKYNTKSHVAKQAKGKGVTDPYHERNGLYPNMYEQLLLEFPHVEILPDVFWDFYEERAHDRGRWLMQLVSLYKDHRMVSLNKGNPTDNNNCPDAGTKDGFIQLTGNDMEKITYSLCEDPWFIKTAKEGYKNLSEEDRELFDLYVDERLLMKLIPEDLL